MEIELQKELAKGWTKENSVPVETSYIPMESAIEPSEEEVKEVGKFLKDKVGIKLTSSRPAARALGKLKRRGRSQEREEDDVELGVKPRGDSSEPTNSKEMQLNSRARESFPQYFIKSIMYTNETEGVLHELMVLRLYPLVDFQAGNGTGFAEVLEALRKTEERG